MIYYRYVILKKFHEDEILGPLLFEIWRIIFYSNLVKISSQWNFNTKKISNDWERITLISIFKSNGDVRNFVNNRQIKHMSYTMKPWGILMKHKHNKTILHSKDQLGFITKRSTKKFFFSFLLRWILEKIWFVLILRIDLVHLKWKVCAKANLSNQT